MAKRWSIAFPRFWASSGRMQNKSLGRLGGDVATGAEVPEPAPEYIEKAGEPSEEAWAHEQELYRRKEQSEHDAD